MLNLTIRKSLILLGGLVLASSATNAIVYRYVSAKINRGVEEIKLAEKMQAAAVENRESVIVMVLAAMDTIVDKDAGIITSERMEELDTSKASFAANTAFLEQHTPSPEQLTMLKKSSEAAESLYTVITGGFKTAIEARASTEALGAFDDTIDETGTEAKAMLASFSALKQQELSATQNRMETELARGNQNIMIANGLSLAALILGLCLLGRFVLTPVNALGRVMQAMTRGDLHVDVPAAHRKDEIGQMASSTPVFQKGLRENETLRRQQQEQARDAEAQQKAMMQNLANQFEREVKAIIQSLAHSATEMRSFAEALNRAAEQAQHRAGAAAAASEQAAANVSTVASATEELSSSISEINRRVTDSSRTSQTAVHEAEQTNQTVEALSGAAQRIGEVVNLISAIAGQTNLLALNATIEAARAGEAGKGFAVVASEVKNLANQTAKATEEITTQIEAIQTSAQDSVRAIKGIGETISKIDSISSAIAAAVEQQGAATQEISRNVQEAAQGTREVTTSIGDVNTAASETGHVAQKVLEAAAALSQQAESLEGGVGAFIARIRAA